MVNYDGPSYFKKNHPKIKKMKQVEEEKPKYTLPKNVQTPKQMQENARQYMKTPSLGLPNDPPPERFPFKRTHIPASLQKLDGWTKQHVDVELYTEIHSRLQKKEDTYLLFADHLSDEMKKKMEEKESEPRHTPTVKEDNVTLVREGIAKDILKPGSGLHRSLSNIMADEQQTIHKNQNSLNKLFNHSQNQKKDKKR